MGDSYEERNPVGSEHSDRPQESISGPINRELRDFFSTVGQRKVGARVRFGTGRILDVMMNKRRTRLVMIFLAVWPAVIQAQSSPTNKWEIEIEKFEESDRHDPPAKGAVLFIGSSTIRFWQSLPEDFPEIQIINRGFGGSEIADCTFYVDRIVIPYHPRIVVLYAGDNDLAGGKTPQQVFEDYTAFVSRVHRQSPRTRIAFISIKPSPARASLLQSMKNANELIKAYTTNDKRLIYIDVFTVMLGKDGNPRARLFGPDRLHMNKNGYSLWKSVIAPYIR